MEKQTIAMDVSRAQILNLFQPILARIDMGILFADAEGNVLTGNEATKQLLELDNDSPFERLENIGGINFLEKFEDSQAQPIQPLDDSIQCHGAIQFELQIGETLDEIRYIQVRSGVIELPCEDGVTRIVMMRDITREKQLAAATASREQATMLSNDAQMLDLVGRIGIIAPTEASILLQGESGTGKTELARMIHSRSHRADGPFVEVNCASIPSSLIESELFGHVKGAFTGASQARTGRFKSANGGTLFLDEVNEFPLELQPKLLRVLQSGQFEAVGSDRTTSVDVRIIVASNQELRPLVDHGLFRADLYYRIAVIPLHVPPLRERLGDIQLLANYFLERFSEQSGRQEQLQLSNESLHLLVDYHWPGNVRELGNAIEHGVICARNGVIQPDDLPYDLRQLPGAPRQQEEGGDDESQRHAIEEALHQAKGNRTIAARLLGVDRTTLWRRMRRLNLT
jgi:transcriptional regulator with PAS, ATPase and Fis domain